MFVSSLNFASDRNKNLPTESRLSCSKNQVKLALQNLLLIALYNPWIEALFRIQNTFFVQKNSFNFREKIRLQLRETDVR